jgi:hypothetical protein
MNSESTGREHPEHEPSDLHTSAVLKGVAAVVAMVVLVTAIAAVLTRETRAVASRSEALQQANPKLLTSNPSEDRAAFEREKRRRLESYGWVDREGQFAHIPIEQAMSLSATRSSTVEHPSPAVERP